MRMGENVESTPRAWLPCFRPLMAFDAAESDGKSGIMFVKL